MVIIGLAFLLCWLLVAVFMVTLAHSLLVTAVAFLALGLLLGERPWNNPPHA